MLEPYGGIKKICKAFLIGQDWTDLKNLTYLTRILVICSLGHYLVLDYG